MWETGGFWSIPCSKPVSYARLAAWAKTFPSLRGSPGGGLAGRGAGLAGRGRCGWLRAPWGPRGVPGPSFSGRAKGAGAISVFFLVVVVEIEGSNDPCITWFFCSSTRGIHLFPLGHLGLGHAKPQIPFLR